jgi:hypothetical protein
VATAAAIADFTRGQTPAAIAADACASARLNT